MLDLSAWPKGMRVIVRRNALTPARSCGSPTPAGTGSPVLPPALRAGSSPTWNYATGAGPGARTGSAAPRTPACATCPSVIFSPTILRSSDLWLCVVDSVVHGPSRGFPRGRPGLFAFCFPGVSWLVSGSSLPFVLRVRARVRRGAGGSLIPGRGCGRWLLPGVAAARRASPAAGPGPVVMTGPAAAGCGAARSAPAGRPGRRARSGKRRQRKRRC